MKDGKEKEGKVADRCRTSIGKSFGGRPKDSRAESGISAVIVGWRGREAFPEGRTPARKIT